MRQADQIRFYVLNEIIVPARKNGLKTVKVRAWDVHQALGLESRMPAVCSALDADKFLVFAHVKLVRRHGPLQSSSVEWVWEV